LQQRQSFSHLQLSQQPKLKTTFVGAHQGNYTLLINLARGYIRRFDCSQSKNEMREELGA
jgi:hypothetical protein